MKRIFMILSWIFGVLFFLLFLLSIFSGHYLPSVFVLLIIILLIPPVRGRVGHTLGFPLSLGLRSMLIPALFLVFIFMIFYGMGNSESIYKNPGIEKKLMRIYDSRISHWPVPYQTRYITTRYGKVHVIISGPGDAQPVLLLHASAMAGWSWLYNIEGLNKYYRTYAIDTIGDAGRSVLADIRIYPEDGQSLSELYAEIMDSLGVQKASFIGASQGGFITANMALYAPERVDKIILCGPMGFTGTNSSVLRILFTTMFPVRPIQNSTTRWAFGDDPKIHEAVGEWFATILEGVISRQARPKPFTREQLQRLSMPVLLLLGKKDGLVGDPENTRQLVQTIPDVRLEILDAGHLISAEKADEFNRLVHEFIENKSGNQNRAGTSRF
ncbi:MAG: alpha/beta fold hydrolase [Calditrichia bacterium]